ncbi:MAG: BspA family leucine-rich repeat surface protein [Bacteroidota bacterium]
MKPLFRFCLRYLLTPLVLMVIHRAGASQSFITSWDTNNPGISNATSITIPTIGAGYNYDVDWNNDGVFDEFGLAGEVTHDFGVAGIYTIRIQGDFPQIYFNNGGDRLKLIAIEQWGNISWTDFENAFSGCTNLSYQATDAPDLSEVKNLSGMFRSTGISTGDFSNWDVATIKDMSFLFSFASQFNADLSAWDVSEVQHFRGMFWGASQFNQPLNSWDVISGVDMSFMFAHAEAFNQPLDDWKVDQVTNMSSMFSAAFAFNGAIGSWEVSQVADMSFMLFSAHSFDQQLGNWPITSVTDMTAMLSNTNVSLSNYDQTLIGWESQAPLPNVSLGAIGLRYCESQSARSSLTGPFNWTIEGDSPDCPYFTTTWQTNNPGTSNVSSISIPTFGEGYDYDVDWNNDGIFDEFGLTGDVTHDFGFPGVYTINIRGDFPRIHFDNEGDKLKIVDISHWGDIEWENMASAFRGCSNLGYSADDTPDLSGVNSMASMFQGASNFNGPIGNWKVLHVTDMAFMFRDASSFNQDLDDWDVSGVTNMSRMFNNATSFNQDLNSWQVANVTDMSRMFDGATVFNGNISDWEVSSVENMSYLFYQADAFNQAIGNWNTASVTNMGHTFFSANAFNHNLGGWDIAAVTNMENMLSNCGLSTFNYDKTLLGWVQQEVQSGVVLGAHNLTYCKGEPAWSELQNTTNSWAILGDSQECPFITTWKTDNPGVSPGNAITIPTAGTNYDYDIDWNNDGVYDQFGVTGSVSHIFPAPGTYTIRIRGKFPRIYFANGGDKDKIINIDSWGDIIWKNMHQAFRGCTNLNSTATDAPDLSDVTNMASMFSDCHSFNAPINHWDVSNVTTMQHLFAQAHAFNQDLNDWNVSKVTNMSYTFVAAETFNGNISDWDVSNVTNMNGTFTHADAFNGDLSSWDVSSVSAMSNLFANTSAFDGDLSNWEVSNVTDMSWMFSNASAFTSDLSNWDVSNVTTMHLMFYDAASFDSNLGDWDITAVTDMFNMLDLCGMSQSNYDNTLIGWAAQNVQLNITLGADGLRYCEGATARAFLTNTKGWEIKNDENACAAFITTWKTDNPGDSPDNAITIPTIGGGYNYDVDWDNDGIYDQFGLDGTITHSFPAPGTYTIRIRGDFPSIYFNDEGDKEKIVNIDQWGENPWTSFDRAFFGCSNLNSTATDTPDLSNVSDMESIFHECHAFNGDISGWEVSNITNMRAAFAEATIFNQDLNGWDVSNVTDMSYMFASATTFNQDLNSWDVSKVTNMTGMFLSTATFDGNISNWEVSNVTMMESMFAQATAFNGAISNWDVSSVTTMNHMFNQAAAFDQNLGNWDITNVSIMIGMLSNSGMSKESYDNTLMGWADQDVQLSIELDANNLRYCQGRAARLFLIIFKGWDIIGDESDCEPFIMTLKTDNPGVSPDNAFSIPTVGGGYNYDVDWNNDGVYDQFGISGGVSAIFPGPGTYTIRIKGNFPRIYFNNGGDKDKVINIEQWGEIEWASMEGAFSGCQNLTCTASDAPNLSFATNISQMFMGALSFNANISHWDITSITSMEGMLSHCGMSTENYDNTIMGWAAQNVQANITLGAHELRYCEGADARAALIDNMNWTIVEDQYDCAALPVEWLAFEARAAEANQVAIHWTTAVEIDNDYFLVERSKDGLDFELIAQVQGQGSTTDVSYYNILDQYPYHGVNYYRLQQVDFDGTVTYSPIVSASITASTTIDLFPNPVSNILNIRFSEQLEATVPMQLYNSVGQLIFETWIDPQATDGIVEIKEVDQLKAGIYYLKIDLGNESFTGTFIKH